MMRPMSDELLTDDEIEAFCTCTQARKDSAVEFQVPSPDSIGGPWKTVYYFHKDCPLHGITRTIKRKVPV